MLFLASLNLFSQQNNHSFQSSSLLELNSYNDNVDGVNQVNFRRKRFAGNIIYAEIGGLGYYYTVNYEMTIQSMDRRMMNLRLGAGFMPETKDGTKATRISLPLLFYLAFGEINQFEVGAGVTYRIFIEKKIIPSASFGFRHQKPFGGFMYRIAFTPTVEMDDAGYRIISFWGGISFGYAF